MLAAGLDALNEEFPYRAALYSQAVPAVGGQQALWITTVLFGVGHFYGIPRGVVVLLLAAFPGWLLSKSVPEAKGFF